MKGLRRRLPFPRAAAWLVRAGLALIVLASLLPLAARSGPISRYVAGLLLEALASRTGREVRVGSVHLEIYPLSLRIRDLDISGPDGTFDDPFLSVRDASASVSIRALLRGEISVSGVEIDGISLSWSSQGGPAASRAHAPGQGGRPVHLRRLNVRNGTIRWEGREGAFRIEAEDVEATAASIACASSLCAAGTASAGRFALAFEDHHVDGEALSLDFEYAGGALTVPRFKMTGAGIEASGRAAWEGGSPAGGELTARFHGEGAALPPLAGSFPVQADAMEASITLSVRGGVTRLTGSGRARNATCFERFRAQRADMSFNYEAGLFTADVTAQDLLVDGGPVRPAGRGPLEASIRIETGAEGRVDLKGGPFLYRDVLAPLDPRLPRVDLLARATGSLRWESGRAGTLSGTLDVTGEPPAPGGAPGGDRPVVPLRTAGRIHVTSRDVRISDGRISAPGLDAEISGRISPGTDQTDLEAHLSRVDLGPVLASLARLPGVDIAREQELSGTVAGPVAITLRPGRHVVRGSLTGTGLSLRSGSQPIQGFSAHVPFVATGATFAIRGLRLAGPGWSAESSLDLDMDSDWPLRSADARFQGMPAMPLWEAMGLAHMEGGTISGSASFDLDEAERTGAEGRFDMTLEGGRLAGVDLTGADLSARERGGTYLIDRLDLRSAAGVASVTGSWAPEPGAGTLDVEATELELAKLLEAWLPERTEDDGLISIQGQAVLTPGRLAFTGSGHAARLSIAGLPFGAVRAERIDYSLGEGATGLDLRVEVPALLASGRVRLGPEEGAPLVLDLTARGTDLSRLRPMLGEETLPGLGGLADFHLEGFVPVDDPWGAELVAQLRSLSLRVGGLEFTMTGEPALELRDGKVRLGATRLVGEGTDLSLSGAYDLRSGSAGTGTLSGSFDARLLALVIPGLQASGTARVDLDVSAEGENVDYRGTLTAAGVRLSYPGSPAPIEDLALTASVDPSGKIEASSISFGFSGGKVTGSGTGRLEGFRLASTEIHLSGKGLSTEPIPALAVFHDAEAVIRTAGARGSIEGRMDVVRAVYRKEFGLQAGAALGGRRVVPDESALSGSSPFTLDLDIVAPSGILVRNNSANLEGSASLEVTGTLARPELTGRIGLFEGGTFRFRDVTYRSAGGGILFDDPDQIDPLLNFSAVADVKEYAITLHVVGRYSKPVFELSSDPPLSQRDIVSLLVTGEIPGTGSGTDTGAGFLAEENVALYLTAPLSETLTSTVGRALGLTSVQLSPHFVNGSADPTARLTLTKRVSPRLLFTYSDNLGTSQDEIYQFEYELSRSWQVIGLRDRDGSASGNLRFRHYWGGPPRAAPLQPLNAPALPQLEISRVEFEGSPIGNERTLRKRSGIRPGGTYSRADALEGREELREWLSREGYPLASVRLEEAERERPDGARVVDLTYEILPDQRVDLDIDGVRHPGSYERAVGEAWLRGIHVDDLARTGQRALEDRLGSKGYAAATVSTSVRPADDEVRIRYEVDQGPKISVESIRFTGAGSVPEEELLRAMSTREDRWNTSGTLRTSELASDAVAIRAVYLSHGFLDVIVREPVVSISPDRKSASIEIPVEEGERWRAGEIVIEGDPSYPAASLAEATLIEPGALLRPSVVQAAVERVRDLLDANGYHTVRVESRVEGSPAHARVVFHVEEGPRQFVDRIQIRGNDRTADRVIQREIDLRPGDPLSRNALLEIQKKLYAIGLFRTVDVRAETLDEDPARARVVVRVVEGDPILTGLGVGYDTEERVQGLAHIGHSNVFGTGRSVSLLLRGSSVSKRVQASMSDRRLFGVPFEGTLTASWEEEERTSFDVRRTGAGVQFRRKISPTLTTLGRYELSDVDLLSVEIDPATTLDDEDQEILDKAVRLGQVGGSLALDTRDDILAPTKGAFVTTDLGVYAQPFGSLHSFARLYLRSSQFVATRGGLVFAYAARLGHEEPFGSTLAVPLAARFFSGGDTTLRGFKVDEAGPLDFTSGEPVGGEFQLLLNGEMRFPIYRALKGVLFYDVGNTFLTLGDFRATGSGIVTTEVSRIGECAFDLDPLTNPGVPAGELTCPVAVQDGLRHTLGVGLRIDTPVGPIRLELGRKLDRRFGRDLFDLGHGFEVHKRREESLYELFLSIGQAF